MLYLSLATFVISVQQTLIFQVLVSPFQNAVMSLFHNPLVPAIAETLCDILERHWRLMEPAHSD